MRCVAGLSVHVGLVVPPWRPADPRAPIHDAPRHSALMEIVARTRRPQTIRLTVRPTGAARKGEFRIMRAVPSPLSLGWIGGGQAVVGTPAWPPLIGRLLPRSSAAYRIPSCATNRTAERAEQGEAHGNDRLSLGTSAATKARRSSGMGASSRER